MGCFLCRMQLVSGPRDRYQAPETAKYTIMARILMRMGLAGLAPYPALRVTVVLLIKDKQD